MRPAIVPPLCLAALVFHPITRNYFFSDDFLHLYQIAQDPLRFLLAPYAGHPYLVRNVAFWAFARVFGPWPAPYFWASLLTHLVSVGLLFGLLRRVTGSDRVACFGATLWGTCPVQEAALGWYSVYGQVLATALVLAVLRDSLRAGPILPGRALVWLLVLLAAATCFGTAVGAALAFPAVIGLLRPEAYARPATRVVLLALPPAVVGMYLGLHALFAAVYADPTIDTAPVHHLLQGWWPITLMLGHLLGGGISELLLGFAYSEDLYPGPVAFALVTLVAAGVAGTLLAGRGPAVRRLLAALLLVVVIYGTIAAGRSLFLALGVPPAALGATPRYHYMGSAAVTLVVGLVVAWLGERLGTRERTATALLAVWFGATGLFFVRSGHRIDHHDSERVESERFLADLHAGVRAQPVGGLVTIENRYFRPVGRLIPPTMFPGSAAAFMIFSPINELDGRPVRFVTSDARALGTARTAGGRLATLLVESAPAPAAPGRAPTPGQ